MKKVKVIYTKLRSLAKCPSKTYKGDAAYDLYSTKDYVLPALGQIEVDTGIAVALPLGYYIEIHTRGSYGRKGIRAHLGIIDEGYRNDLRVILVNASNKSYSVTTGDKVAQLIIKERIEVEWINKKSLSKSDRGIKGFGSTGR